MKNLATLVKLNKHKVQATIKELAKLRGSKELMERRLEELKTKMYEEIDQFANTEYAFMLDKYVEAARIAQDKLLNNIENVNNKLLEAEALIQEQFTELKKYEIVLKNRNQAAKEALSLQEAKNQDEINIMKFPRQN